jgi:hypothetical protein
MTRPARKTPLDLSNWTLPEIPALPESAKQAGRQQAARALATREQALADQKMLSKVPPGGIAYGHYAARFTDNHDLLTRLVDQLNRWYRKGATK